MPSENWAVIKIKIGYLCVSGSTTFKINAAIPPVATPELKYF
ncbi:hypothetical protein KKPNMP14_56880 [Klebsiella pneumoniae subsp. pneumoniae MP14]|nr:hypothetical protein KKPNMP14_56880 [Klebsiella pneumoniae subsp. pneumoniae MP14]